MKLSMCSFVSGFRRHLAAIGAATAVVASGLLMTQPVAAATSYQVLVTFDNVQFTKADDGCMGFPFCSTDPWLDTYGSVGAFTSAGTSSAGGLPYRLFGKWGSNPCDVDWWASSGATCLKEVTDWPLGTHPYDFSNVLLCDGAQYQTCSTAYIKFNNSIALQVHPGEQIYVTSQMYDYDAASSDDAVCTGYLTFGPYTDAQLQAKKYIQDSLNRSIFMPYNGSAECFLAFHLS